MANGMTTQAKPLSAEEIAELKEANEKRWLSTYEARDLFATIEALTAKQDAPVTNPTDTAEEAAPSPEHVEHVARAMYNANPNKTPGWLDWDQMHYGYKLPWIAVATAAILSSQEWLEKNGAGHKNK